MDNGVQALAKIKLLKIKHGEVNWIHEKEADTLGQVPLCIPSLLQ